MQLSWRIKIVDQMIEEDPDYTIADYAELIKDLNKIQDSLYTSKGKLIELIEPAKRIAI